MRTPHGAYRLTTGTTRTHDRVTVTDLLGNAPEWQERALCAQTDPEAFFPEKGGTTADAKRICARCEVRPDCLLWALQRREPHGVWGGTSERERRKILRDPRLYTAAVRAATISAAA